MNQLEDLLREAYGQERFTMTVPEIEARARKAKRRRTKVALAAAGGLTFTTLLAFVAIPLPKNEPPALLPMPTVAPEVTPTESQRPVSRADECREMLAKAGRTNLGTNPPVEVIDGGQLVYIFSDGNSYQICTFSDSAASPGWSMVDELVAPLGRTVPGYVGEGDGNRELIVGLVPYGMRQFEYFNQAGTWPLASNGTVLYGHFPASKGFGFTGLKASAGEVFVARATTRQVEKATTSAAQQSACRATQLLMPVPHSELTLLGRREIDSKVTVLLLAGADGLLAVCRIMNGATSADVMITIANHPIYAPSLEESGPDAKTHRDVVLLQRFSEDAGRGRVILNNGQTVPLSFARGYASAWFDRPKGVEADHIEVDLAAGGHTDYPK